MRPPLILGIVLVFFSGWVQQVAPRESIGWRAAVVVLSFAVVGLGLNVLLTLKEWTGRKP